MTFIPVNDKCNGFTLIETMIAVAVSAMLAAVTLPWFGNSIRKTRVAEGVMLAAPARLNASNEALKIDMPDKLYKPAYTCGVTKDGKRDCGDSGWTEDAKKPNEYIDSIVRKDNMVVVNYSSKLTGSDKNMYSLVFVGQPTATGLQWECVADEAAKAALSKLSGAPVQTAMPAKLAPAHCRTS